MFPQKIVTKTLRTLIIMFYKSLMESSDSNIMLIQMLMIYTKDSANVRFWLWKKYNYQTWGTRTNLFRHCPCRSPVSVMLFYHPSVFLCENSFVKSTSAYTHTRIQINDLVSLFKMSKCQKVKKCVCRYTHTHRWNAYLRQRTTAYGFSPVCVDTHLKQFLLQIKQFWY